MTVYEEDKFAQQVAGKSSEGPKIIATDISGKVLFTRETFEFHPGASALANGAVASGTRSGSATITNVNANETYWQAVPIAFVPARSGKIDGVTTGGVVSGQITIGIKSSAATPNGKLTARIRNKDGTWTTFLALTGAIALSMTEAYYTYDIPYLLTTAEFNEVPFEIEIGIQSDSAVNLAIARIMESSYIQGEFEPDVT